MYKPFQMPERFRLPDSEHWEYNEDYKMNRHPGYLVKVCKTCDREFILARSLDSIIQRITTCGRESCGEKMIG